MHQKNQEDNDYDTKLKMRNPFIMTIKSEILKYLETIRIIDRVQDSHEEQEF